MDEGARLRVTLLGPLRVSRGTAVVPVPGARLRGLLVRLALAGGRAVEPGVLAGAIWAAELPAVPGHALQTLVSRLRRAVDVVLVAGGYRLVVDADDVDALRFERLAATGRDRLRAGEAEAAQAALTEAVALWGDRPGAEPPVVAAVAPAVAIRLAQVSVEAVADLADAELSLGRADVAADRLARLLAEQPAHERAAASLMDALAAQGRQAEALTVYERIRRTLADDLGADPGTALRERHLRLLRADHAVPAPDSLISLPAPLTSFVGREDDLARVDALLGRGRLVTVVGPGGAGKTRLALEAARRRARPAWLVDLASVTEPAEITGAVLAGIGLRGLTFDARKRVEGDQFDVLAGEIGRRDGLLLVDNCEHLIDAVAHLVVALLTRCPGLRVLATSREPLAVDGEALLPLAELTLPAPDDGVEQAGKAASVRLFTERAAAVRPGFRLDAATLPDVVRVVRGLDGLPLALELAAARLRTLSLPDLADGLSDRFRLLTTGSRTAPPRHRTLRAVIAWSWDLLGDHERTVAERISVLPGGVTPVSAAAVCAGTAVPAAEIPALLAALVDRSLLQLAPGSRYRMLETLREYGADRLTAAGDLGVARDLAAVHFTDLMTRHEPRLRGPGQLTAMKVIGAEYDNTLAALRHLCATRDPHGAIGLTLSLTWYWQMCARHSDAAHWLDEALAVPGGEPTPERDCARAASLLNRADTRPETTTAEDPAEIRELAARLLEHAEPPGHYRVFGPILLFLYDKEAALAAFGRLADGDDVWLAGLAHMFLAEITENAGALDRTRVHLEAALARFHEAGDRWGRAATLPLRARLRRYDDLDGALADLREAGTLAGEFGSLSIGDRIYGDLRWIDLHVRRGDVDRALALLDAAGERAAHASSAELPALVDACEADLRIRLGDLARAVDLLDPARPFPDHAKVPVASARVALHLAQGDRPGAEKALREAHAAAAATGELPVLALVAVHAAALAEARESAVLLGVAARLRGAHDHTDPRIGDLTRRGHAALGEAGFAEAYARGWEMDGTTAAAHLGRAASGARDVPVGPGP